MGQTIYSQFLRDWVSASLQLLNVIFVFFNLDEIRETAIDDISTFHTNQTKKSYVYLKIRCLVQLQFPVLMYIDTGYRKAFRNCYCFDNQLNLCEWEKYSSENCALKSSFRLVIQIYSHSNTLYAISNYVHNTIILGKSPKSLKHA